MILYLFITITALLASRYVTTPERIGGRAFHALGQASLRVSSLRHPLRSTRAQSVSRIAMLFLFLILFLPLALRVNTGNDYAKYVDFMHLIRSHAYVPTEPGFNAFVYCVYAICGYENYLLVFALIGGGTLALFLCALWRQADDFAFSFFLFLMLGYYFQTYNTVRYYFALALVICAAEFLVRREYAPFVCLVLLAGTFHKSALVVLLLYPLAQLRWKKWMIAAGVCLCISFPVFQGFWMKVLLKLYPSYRDTEYLAGSGLNPAGIARCAAVLLLAGIVWRCGRGKRGGRKEMETRHDRQERFWLHCTVLALALYVFCSFLPILSRITYYLTITQILYIPRLLSEIPEKAPLPEKMASEEQRNAAPGEETISAGAMASAAETKSAESENEAGPGHLIPAGTVDLRKFFTALVILAAVLYFVLFLRKLSSEELRILPYHSFLFTDMPKTLSQMSD